MKKGSKPAFIAEALARGDIAKVKEWGHKGGLKAAQKRRDEKAAKQAAATDDEEELYDQAVQDPTIIRIKAPSRKRKRKKDEEYYFGGL